MDFETGGNRGGHKHEDGWSFVPMARGAGCDQTCTDAHTTRRPVMSWMIRTTTAMTRSRWISPPAIWKLNPRSHRISRMTKIVQSMHTLLVCRMDPRRTELVIRLRNLDARFSTNAQMGWMKAGMGRFKPPARCWAAAPGAEEVRRFPGLCTAAGRASSRGRDARAVAGASPSRA